MSDNLSVSTRSPLKWDPETVYYGGVDFLKQKIEIINLYEKLWFNAIWPEYKMDSLKASERLKNVAIRSVEEIRQLYDAAIEALDISTAQDSFSPNDKDIELVSKIALASQFAMNYFQSLNCAPACPSRKDAEERIKKWRKEFETAVSLCG